MDRFENTHGIWKSRNLPAAVQDYSGQKGEYIY